VEPQRKERKRHWLVVITWATPILGLLGTLLMFYREMLAAPGQWESIETLPDVREFLDAVMRESARTLIPLAIGVTLSFVATLFLRPQDMKVGNGADTQVRLAKWELIRMKGVRHYLLWWGFGRFGLPVFLVSALFHNPLVNPLEGILQFLILCPFAGGLWGLWWWLWNEKFYLRHQWK
jgi:hypothetical protein